MYEIDIDSFIRLVNAVPSKKLGKFIQAVDPKKLIYLIENTSLWNLSDLISLTQPIKILVDIINKENNFFIFAKLIKDVFANVLARLLNNTDLEKLLSLINNTNYEKLVYLIHHTDPSVLSHIINSTSFDRFTTIINSSETAQDISNIVNSSEYTSVLAYLIENTGLKKLSEILSHTKTEVFSEIINSTSFNVFPTLINETNTTALSYILSNTPLWTLQIIFENIWVNRFCKLVNNCNYEYLSDLFIVIEPWEFCELVKKSDHIALINVFNNISAKLLAKLFNEYEVEKIAKHLKYIFKNLEMPWYIKKGKQSNNWTWKTVSFW